MIIWKYAVMQREIKSLALIYSVSKDPSVNKRSQQNCKKLKGLTNRKTERKATCKAW